LPRHITLITLIFSAISCRRYGASHVITASAAADAATRERQRCRQLPLCRHMIAEAPLAMIFATIPFSTPGADAPHRLTRRQSHTSQKA